MEDGHWNICVVDHEDHIHIRINVNDDEASEWVRIPAPWELAKTLLPASTNVHMHEAEAEGCSERLIHAIPQMVWGQNPFPSTATSSILKSRATSHQEDTCAICFEHFSPGDEVKLLPCSHRYHSTCVATWLEQHDSCPTCRLKITQQVVDQALQELSLATGG